MSGRLSCEVAVLGGGLAGLACAVELQRRGRDVLLLEGSEQVGGRVATERRDGFLLDRGFQVFLDSYPTARRLLNLDGLELAAFHPGARIHLEGRCHTVADPLRRPAELLSTLLAPIGGLGDKLNLLRLVAYCRDPAKQAAVEGMPSEEFLSLFGFSESMVERFFRPFFGGVFLEDQLLTSAGKLLSLFNFFSRGRACLPAHGMAALPLQLAEQLPAERRLLGRKVERWHPDGGVATSGETVDARVFVLAANGIEQSLLGRATPPTLTTTTIAYEAPGGGFSKSKPSRWLELNGGRDGSVQTVAFNSVVQPSYAPDGSHLVMVGCRHGAPVRETQVREELAGWYGREVLDWRPLEMMEVPAALPLEMRRLKPPHPLTIQGRVVLCCGDHTESGSIQGALLSGCRAAATALAWPRTA